MAEVCEHDVQLVGSSKQLWQVLLQSRHTPSPSVVLRYFPVAHADVHVPASAVKVEPTTHERQPEEVPSLHVAQVASQALQVLLVSAYLLLGQLAKHAPSSEKGVPVSGQLRQEALEAPLHVAQDA